MSELTPMHVLALRRSSVKRRILAALVRHGPSYVAELQRLCAATPSAILGALDGDDVKYSRALSLRSLRLVTRDRDPLRCLELTPLGEAAFREILQARPSGRL